MLHFGHHGITKRSDADPWQRRGSYQCHSSTTFSVQAERGWRNDLVLASSTHVGKVLWSKYNEYSNNSHVPFNVDNVRAHRMECIWSEVQSAFTVEILSFCLKIWRCLSRQSCPVSLVYLTESTRRKWRTLFRNFLNASCSTWRSGRKKTKLKSLVCLLTVLSFKQPIVALLGDCFIFRGIIRKNSIWDRLVFGALQKNMGGRLRLMITGSAPLAGNVLTFMRCALGCIVSLTKIKYIHVARLEFASLCVVRW